MYEGPQCAICTSKQPPEPEPIAESRPTVKAPRPDPEILKIVDRLHRHLASIPRRFPDAWKWVDQMLASRGSKTIGDWPSWCFMPLAGAYAIASRGRNDILPQHSETAAVGALAAWRVTKGIYRFDETAFEELWDTPIAGDLPVTLLERLPAWCCYIAFPQPRWLSFSGVPNEFFCHGFFVHLEYDQATGRRELRFLLDYESQISDRNVLPGLTGLMLHLTGNLTNCVQDALNEMQRHFVESGEASPGYEAVFAKLREHMAEQITPLVSLTLYLCSTNAEIATRGGYHPPPLRRDKNEPTRILAAETPIIWDVAYRIGAALRAANEEQKRKKMLGGHHAGPRPHIRRPHWHSFWTGEKAKRLGQQTKRELILKWIPVTRVNFKEGVEPVPTVHRVLK